MQVGEVHEWKLIKLRLVESEKKQIAIPNYAEQEQMSQLNINFVSDENIWLCYLQCTLVTVATILGTGILGLPSTLAYSGLTPFVLTFVANFIAQVFIVILFTEVMVLCRNEDNQVKRVHNSKKPKNYLSRMSEMFE